MWPRISHLLFPTASAQPKRHHSWSVNDGYFPSIIALMVLFFLLRCCRSDFYFLLHVVIITLSLFFYLFSLLCFFFHTHLMFVYQLVISYSFSMTILVFVKYDLIGGISVYYCLFILTGCTFLFRRKLHFSKKCVTPIHFRCESHFSRENVQVGSDF